MSCCSVYSGSFGIYKLISDEDANLGDYKSYVDTIPVDKLYSSGCSDVEKDSGIWELMMCLDQIEAEKVCKDHRAIKKAIEEFKTQAIGRPILTSSLLLPAIIVSAIHLPLIPVLAISSVVLTANVTTMVLKCNPILEKVGEQIKFSRLKRIAVKVAFLSHQIEVFTREGKIKESRNATILKSHFFMTLATHYELFKKQQKGN